MDRLVASSSLQAAALPRLREELRLIPGDPHADGSPAWLVQDPVANRFFRIGWVDFEVLLRWQLGTPADIVRSVGSETTLRIEEADVLSLDAFLRQHALVQRPGAADVDAIRKRAASQTRSASEWLLHHYLFFRLPLVRPQDKLARLMPALRWLFTPAMMWVAFVVSALGLALVARQWDTFTGSLVDHLTWQGAFGFALALGFAKTVHELGHAFTATRYGVRVAHMGVAMVVMFPMLYTDTSESWKLSNSRQRLAIASAGIVAELALAGVATLMWSLAPEGGLRTAMFFLATTSWVTTLVVNASPFMRFDGYFILCDLVDFPNLHERAGGLARAWLRRVVAGIEQAWPEELPTRSRRLLIAFAIATWIYRFFVFLGIAVLVYVYCFKVLGIALLIVEVGWFIAKPVYSELKEWWARRSDIRRSRKSWALVAGVLLLLVAVVPWHASVHGAAVVRAERQHLVFAPRSGEVVALPKNLRVQSGELLFALDAPDLANGEQRAQALASARALQLVGLAGVQDGEERRASLQSEHDRFVAEADMYSGEHSRMQLVAPFAGNLLDVDPNLRTGVWVQTRHPLAILVDPTSWVAEAFVAEDDIGRLKKGDEARVYCGSRAIDGIADEVDSSRTTSLPYPMLDAALGGPIPTLPSSDDHRGDRAVRDGLFRVRIALSQAPPNFQMSLCRAVIAGAPRSLLHGVLDNSLATLIRESGF